MSKRKWVGMVLAISLITAACGGTTEPTTTTTTTTTTTPETPDTTTGPGGFNLADYAPPELTACYFLPNVISAPEGSAAEIIDFLDAEDVGIEAAPISAADILGPRDPEEQEHPLDAQLDLIAILNEADNAAFVAEFLKVEGGFSAGVIHAMGLAAHWRMKPGTNPISEDADQLFDPDIGANLGYIAVVDSGIVPATSPDWIFDSDIDPSSDDGVVYEDPLDVETAEEMEALGGVSHGTFIAGLLRQLAPSYRVSFAKAHSVSLNEILAYPDPAPSPDVSVVTTELHVFDAIDRLVERHTIGENEYEAIKALNLSLGTYACDSNAPITLVPTMELALMRWTTTVGQGGQIFAAAGNEGDTHGSFYPAALSDVRGVAAVSESGDEIVWNEAKNPPALVPQPRGWRSDWAPGCDLVSLSGGQNGDVPFVVSWSGSSFATSAAAAAFAQNNQATDTQTDYAGFGPVPFSDHGSCDVAP